ncbi:set1/Ash2 histone methyltransferase complex subunit ASH2-like isoform X2 [Pomacea canaliculata]|nr:set1/Ash2 histone methyltransferase complex subunit ASH2-like isoform X2 [Pomacea canaliculata]
MADDAGDKNYPNTKEAAQKTIENGALAEKKAEAEPMDTDASTAGSQSQGEEETAETPKCYCGQPRSLGCVELLCGTCLAWFHSECVSVNIGKSLPFMTCYQFCCKKCSPTESESFIRRQATFSQMCQQAIANLILQSANEDGQTSFSKEMEIIPFIDKNWENLTTMNRRVKLTWHNTVSKTMTKETDIFACSLEDGTDSYYTLVNQDLSRIAPSYDVFKGSAVGLNTVDTKSRSAKRKAPFDSNVFISKQKKSDLNSGTRVPAHGYPLEHPYNKDGYRYILAESDPHAPNRQAFDDSVEWAGKPIPGYLYRMFLGSQVLLSMHDRAPQLKLSDDRLTVTGEKGYSMIRASHGVVSGQWFYEVTIDEMQEPTATRIGWSQSLGNLQAPCGYDKFSYSWRSRKGTRFHQSHGYHYCDGGYGEGDVLGFFVSLPVPADREKWLPQTFKDRPLVKFKSHLYFEEKDCVSEAEKNLKPAKGSKMIMYKNGQSIGVAFEDVHEGTYYPAVSLYKAATVTVNFGPDFKFPPSDQENFRPMSEAANQAMVDYALADILFHIDNEGKLPEF